MKSVIFTAVVSLGVLFSAGADAAAIKDGQWSMTTNIRVEGMDDQMAEAQKEMENMSEEDRAMMENMMGGMGMKMGGPGGMGMSVTSKQCITNDNPVPKSAEDEDCEDTHSFRGNTLHFESVCKDSRSTGTITYRNTSMNGTIETVKIVQGKEEKATIDISGKYVGPCGQELSESASQKVRSAAKKRVLTDDDSGEDSVEDPEDEPAPENTGKAKKIFGGLKALMGQ